MRWSAVFWQIELSKASWIVAVHAPLSDKISRYTLEGCDWKGLLELIGRIRKRVTREYVSPDTSPSFLATWPPISATCTSQGNPERLIDFPQRNGHG